MVAESRLRPVSVRSESNEGVLTFGSVLEASYDTGVSFENTLTELRDVI